MVGVSPWLVVITSSLFIATRIISGDSYLFILILLSLLACYSCVAVESLDKLDR